jgi:O-antigen/teichoic acid export membrane protein
MSGISLGRVTTLLLMSRAAGFVLTLGNSVILARVLGAERLGEYAYAMGLAALFGLLPNMGISTVVTRAIARDPVEGTGVFGAALRAQVLLAGLVFSVIPAFAAFLPEQPVPLMYVWLAAAQMALGALSWPYLAVLGGRARYDSLAKAELATGVVGTTALLVAAALDGSVRAFLVAHVIAAGIAVLIARQAAAPFLPAGVMQTMTLRTLFRQGAPFGAGAAVQSLYTRLDILLLGQMATTIALGLYSAAYKPINMAVYFGVTAAGTLFPLMVQTPKGSAPDAFGRVMRGLGVAAPAMALIFSGLAAPLLQTLYGDEFAPAAPILIMLAWSAAANWLYAPLGVVLQARGWEHWWLAGLGGGLVVNFLLNLWSIPRWGAIGAAAATLISEAGLLGFATVLILRELSHLPSFRPVLGGLAASVAGGGSLWWLLREIGPIPATLGAFVVYCGLLVLLRIVTFQNVATAMGWIRQAALEWSRS